MFKGKKGSNSSASKVVTCLHDDESNITTSSKKSKKKFFFNSLKNKISSVLEGKNKGTAGHTHDKTCRSKSFEVLSNSFEESHERTSSSEDSVLDRSKWGSKRSQSVRSKQTICPAEFGVPQVASNSTRTGFQSEDNDNNQLINNICKENENIQWTNSFVNNPSVRPQAESLEESPNPQSMKGNHLETKIEKKETININKNISLQNSILFNSSQYKELTTVNYKDLCVSISPCLQIDDGECKSLAKEIQELSKYGWYWGPLNRNEAEEKLADQPDGAFLVRDSSDVKYLLSLSFRSYDKTLHTRIEHSNGWFSFYPQPDHDSYRSVIDLINHCMSESDGGVFCYSRPLIKGSPSFPVRLTKPVSRFMQVRCLQYLCRFVIRQYTSINHIQNLPIPPKIQGYLKESYY